MGEARGRVGDYLRNLREFEGSAAEKARLVLRNTWARRRTRVCCGNHGEPGC